MERLRSSAGRSHQGQRGLSRSPHFRNWDFDVYVFITFDAYTYGVLQALAVACTGVQTLAAPALEPLPCEYIQGRGSPMSREQLT